MAAVGESDGVLSPRAECLDTETAMSLAVTATGIHACVRARSAVPRSGLQAAFYKCTSLTSVTIPDSVTWYIFMFINTVSQRNASGSLSSGWQAPRHALGPHSSAKQRRELLPCAILRQLRKVLRETILLAVQRHLQSLPHGKERAGTSFLSRSVQLCM